MGFRRLTGIGAALGAVALLAACGGGGTSVQHATDPSSLPIEYNPNYDKHGRERDTIWDLFTNVDDPNTTLEVNRFIWQASLDIFNFLPIETVDPFSGVIVFGYGTPPGGGTSYRATVYITDPSLDARALKVAMATRSGPVDPDTVRTIEDAILSRARQIHIAAGAL